MRSGQLGGFLPVLLLVGGIAAPLGVAELTDRDAPAPGLNVRFAPATHTAPSFLPNPLQPASTTGCELPEGGAITLGMAPTEPTKPYALPVAEGAAPAVPHHEIAKPIAAPTVLGSQLRVGEPIASVDLATSCAPKPEYRAAPVLSPFKT